MLSARQTDLLLDRLCNEFGLCLSPYARRTIRDHGMNDVDAFANGVFLADGQDPEAVDRRLFRRVRALIAQTVEDSERGRFGSPLA